MLSFFCGVSLNIVIRISSFKVTDNWQIQFCICLNPHLKAENKPKLNESPNFPMCISTLCQMWKLRLCSTSCFWDFADMQSFQRFSWTAILLGLGFVQFFRLYRTAAGLLIWNPVVLWVSCFKRRNVSVHPNSNMFWCFAF